MSISLMAQAWKVEGVTQNEKIVLLALCDCANDAGMCFPSVSALQDKCSTTDRSVRRALASLEAGGFLRREARDGRCNVYWLTLGETVQTSRNPGHSVTPDRKSPLTQCHTTPDTVSYINITEPSIEPSVNHHTISAREENKRPVTSNPGGEGPHNGEQAKPVRNAKKRKHAVDEWTGPSDRTWELIAKAGIERGFAESLLDEFRLYWEERAELRPGWEATFLNHVKTRWERQPAKTYAPITNQRGKYDGNSGSKKFNAHQYINDWIRAEGGACGETDLQGDVIDVRAEVVCGVTDGGPGS